MLVLSRKPGESIMVGNHKITVIGVVGGKIKIGVDAPGDVKVLRLELYERAQGDCQSKGAAA